MNWFTTTVVRVRAWPPGMRFASAALLVAAGTGMRLEVAALAPGYPYFAYLPAIVLSAVFLGLAPSVAASVASSALALWLFVAPAGELWAKASIDIVGNLAFLAGALALSVAVDAAFRAFLALRAALEGIGEPFYAIDANWRVLHASRAALEVWGLRADQVVGRHLRDALPEAVGTASFAALEDAMRARRAMRVEAISPSVKRWIEVDIHPTHNGGLSVAFRDVHERRAAQEHQRLLVAELTHRIKNNLALVLAIADQTRRSVSSPDAFHAVFQQRLAALARAYDALLPAGGAETTIEDVARQALAPYGPETARLTIAGPRARLSPSLAITLGMAFHELATNAAKYGALSVPTGRIRLTWTSEVDGAGHRYHDMLWEEVGGPPIAQPPAHRGFGARLLERALASQAGATLRLEFAPAGLRCLMRVPDLDQDLDAQDGDRRDPRREPPPSDRYTNGPVA